MIIIVNYGMGNLGSILNMFVKAGAEAAISSNVREIEYADKLVLPGVGSFDNAMRNMDKLGLTAMLERKVIREKTPILGICLGMQLFTERSEEGKMRGLGWLKAKTVRFKFENTDVRLKIPHMGWNTVMRHKESCLLDGLGDEMRFYFIHSYHVVCERGEEALLKTSYGYEFISAVQKDNIIGVQFHPEKSHMYGMRLLKNFSSMNRYA